MPSVLQFRRTTTAGLASITGQAGELLVDTTKKTITVHDGTTAGGTPVATESYVSTSLTAYATTSSLSAYATTSSLTNYVTTATYNAAMGDIAAALTAINGE
jgi:hypothetical protein